MKKNFIKKIIVVMPVANEEDTMEELLDQLLAFSYDNFYIYPVIDAYSKDRTEEIIRRKEKETGRVKCIFYKESKGVISCYLEGFRQALKDGAEWIIEMDGGMSHLPKELPQFVEKLEEGYDCVWGSRFMKGGEMTNLPFYRRVLSQGGTYLSNFVLGTKLKDMTSGFEAFTREVMEQMNLDAMLSTGHMYQTEMRYYCRKLKTKEVPIHYIGGSSSLKASSVTEALKLLFKIKKNEVNFWKLRD